MKIAFVGTHGVGKTILCVDVFAFLRKNNFTVMPLLEVARYCPLPINENTTLEAQLWIIHKQIAFEIREASQCDILITDRSVLDNYAYLVNRFGEQKYLHSMLKNWMNTYDYCFRVPITERKIQNDKFRSLSKAFQKKIDKLVVELFDKFKVPLIELHPSDWNKWPNQVIGIIKKNLKK
jgi:nicotinamide riboside kinase